MDTKKILLVIAAVLFAVDAIWHKSILAAGLAFLAAAFLF